MINYGKRQFIRYVMMGLAFALVTFILNSCNVKAMTYAKSEYLTYYKDAQLTQPFATGAWFGRDEGLKVQTTCKLGETQYFILTS